MSWVKLDIRVDGKDIYQDKDTKEFRIEEDHYYLRRPTDREYEKIQKELKDNDRS